MVKIDAKGTIVNNDDKWIYDWFGYDAFCPKDIDKQLEDIEKYYAEIAKLCVCRLGYVL